MDTYQKSPIDGTEKDRSLLLSSHYMYLPDPTYAELDYRASWATNSTRRSKISHAKPSDIVKDPIENHVVDGDMRQWETLHNPSYIAQTSQLTVETQSDGNHRTKENRSKVVISIIDNDVDFHEKRSHRTSAVNKKYRIIERDMVTGVQNRHSHEKYHNKKQHRIIIPNIHHEENIVYDGLVEGYHYEVTDSYKVWNIDDHDSEKVGSLGKNNQYYGNDWDPLQGFYKKDIYQSNATNKDIVGVHYKLKSLPITMSSPNEPASKQIIKIGDFTMVTPGSSEVFSEKSEHCDTEKGKTPEKYIMEDDRFELENMKEIIIEEKQAIQESEEKQAIPESKDDNPEELVNNLDNINLDDYQDHELEIQENAHSVHKQKGIVPPLDLTYTESFSESGIETPPPVAPLQNMSSKMSSSIANVNDTHSSKGVKFKSSLCSTDKNKFKQECSHDEKVKGKNVMFKQEKEFIKDTSLKETHSDGKSKSLDTEIDLVPNVQVYRPTIDATEDPYIQKGPELQSMQHRQSWYGDYHYEGPMQGYEQSPSHQGSPVLSGTLETIPEAESVLNSSKGDRVKGLLAHESGLLDKKRSASKEKGGNYNIPRAEDDEWLNDNPPEGIGCCGYVLLVCSWILIFFTLPVSLCLCIKVVQEYERAVIFRLGRLIPGGAKGPGLFFITPCMDNYVKIDLRTVTFDVPPQEVLSKDSVTVAVDAVVYYRISNATVSVTNVEDANRSTRLLAATTLRNTLGTKNLSEILSDRENISHMMQSSLDEATDPWGVKVERVEIKDVRLPVQLQRAMAAEAEAAREARAKVIAAEGEHKASRALKDAADIINESPAALQLRYLQTLNTISAEKNSTIIFPLPLDLLEGFVNRKS